MNSDAAREAVLAMTRFCGGGIEQWLDMRVDELMRWVNAAQRLVKS